MTPPLVAFSFFIVLASASNADSDLCPQRLEDPATDLRASHGAALLQRVQRVQETSKSSAGASGGEREGLDGLDGLLAPLTEAGYARVSSLHSPEQMDQFVRRTVISMGVDIKSLKALSHVVPHDSGAAGIPPSFDALKSKIEEAANNIEASFVGERTAGQARAESERPVLAGLATAMASLVGERAVRPAIDETARPAHVEGLFSPPVLAGLATSITSLVGEHAIRPASTELARPVHVERLGSETSAGGSQGAQPHLAWLATDATSLVGEGVADQASAEGARPVHVEGLTTETGMLSERAAGQGASSEAAPRPGLVADAPLASDAGMLAASPGVAAALRRFVANYGAKIQGTYAGQETGLGETSGIDEAGYSAVSALKNNYEMEAFVRRTVENLGLVVSDERGLRAMVHRLTEEAASSSFGNLKGKILNVLGKPDAWVTDPNEPAPPLQGSDAPLSEEGYMFTSNLHSNVEMVSFIDRVVDSMGLKVQNHGGVEGLAPFFSGDKQVGNFHGLKSEILKASKEPSSWVATGI